VFTYRIYDISLYNILHVSSNGLLVIAIKQNIKYRFSLLLFYILHKSDLNISRIFFQSSHITKFKDSGLSC
jgi:hypothetical protein